VCHLSAATKTIFPRRALELDLSARAPTVSANCSLSQVVTDWATAMWSGSRGLFDNSTRLITARVTDRGTG
jgi:hypothetical protein